MEKAPSITPPTPPNSSTSINSANVQNAKPHTQSLQTMFEWGRVLGKGTFGEVVLVNKRDTNESFAMKVISKSNLRSKQDLNFLLREIKILKKIQHPNILRLFQVFESEKKVYLQVEYCIGRAFSWEFLEFENHFLIN